MHFSKYNIKGKQLKTVGSNGKQLFHTVFYRLLLIYY